MRNRYKLAIALVTYAATLPSAARSVLASQPSALVVTVVDSLGGFPLANADIIDLATSQHRFTDEHGQVTLAWPSNGVLRLRAREVGYAPRQRTLQQSVAGGATTFAMSKVAYVLPAIMATSRCTSSDTSSLDLSVAVLDQLKQGAEKYNEFRRTYPFEATVERRTAAVPSPDRSASAAGAILVRRRTARRV